MIRTTLVAAAIIALASPAFSMPKNNITAATMNSLTCEQLMDRFTPMYYGMEAGATRNQARAEMELGKKSLAAGDEADCKVHLQKAIVDTQ